MTSNAVRSILLSSALVTILLPFITNAQSAATESGMASPVYDLNKEVKIDGTIDKIETNSSGGPIGTHLLVISAQGVVDVHLGSERGCDRQKSRPDGGRKHSRNRNDGQP